MIFYLFSYKQFLISSDLTPTFHQILKSFSSLMLIKVKGFICFLQIIRQFLLRIFVFNLYFSFLMSCLTKVTPKYGKSVVLSYFTWIYYICTLGFNESWVGLVLLCVFGFSILANADKVFSLLRVVKMFPKILLASLQKCFNFSADFL